MQCSVTSNSRRIDGYAIFLYTSSNSLLVAIPCSYDESLNRGVVGDDIINIDLSFCQIDRMIMAQ